MFEIELLAGFLVFATVVSVIQIRLAGSVPFDRPEHPVTPSPDTENTADLHPHPIWKVNEFGVVTWSNHAAQTFSPRLFTAAQSPNPDQGSKRRICFRTDDQPDAWLDITMVPEPRGGTYFATPADGEIAAHENRKDFVNSLSHTFAQLSTGLAVFDRCRCLISFNPSLLDLTGLDFSILSSRPHLFSFMDHLRDIGIFPEPKDYSKWRKHLGTLSDPDGPKEFQDLWTLPHGQTIRVTGRPHADGTIVFLFEDITSETEQVRSYRSKLNVLESSLNQLELGIALFDVDGTAIHINDTCQQIWGLDKAKISDSLRVADYARIWRMKSEKSDFWNNMRGGPGQQQAQKEQLVVQSNGQLVQAEFSKLPNMSSLVTFRPIPHENETQERARA